jgi:hypothetical protein
MLGFVLIIIFCFLLILIAIGVIGWNGDSESGRIFILLMCLVIWLLTEHYTVRYGKPTAISHSKLSVMVDNEMAIVRHGNDVYQYTEVWEYNAIKNGDFDIMETKAYDVLGEYNGSTFELVTK